MTAETFPYFTALHVNDCYTYRDFDIPIGEGDGKPFRHLILTGRNGSGKTTILRGIDDWIHIAMPKPGWSKNKPSNVEPKFEGNIFKIKTGIYRYFEAHRKLKVKDVSSVQSENEFDHNVSEQGLSPLLKQFLVNRKINQAFAIIEKNGDLAEKHDKFFENLESIFQNIFVDKKLKMVFVPKEFEFYLEYSNGHRATFNYLSDGYSAFISIVLELLVQVNKAQAIQNDNSLDPCGIVLIDEPESHLHLEMQYQVMPLLTRLFPNIQFIVATHSPAVASSIKNATVFDLTSKEVAPDWVVGSSFSELMQVHFGLDNEFSNIADGIMAASQKIADSAKKPEEKLSALSQLFKENERYLSPAFHLALESQILRLEKALKPA